MRFTPRERVVDTPKLRSMKSVSIGGIVSKLGSKLEEARTRKIAVGVDRKIAVGVDNHS